MSGPLFFYRARLSFPHLSQSLLETGRTMARFAELAVEVMAPELTWVSAVAEHADFGVLAHWEATHVVRFEGRSRHGDVRGRAESRLAAGGKGSQLGASARIVIETVNPNRRLAIETPCDVTHWDFRGGPLEATQMTRLRSILEVTLERGSQETEAGLDEFELGPHTLVTTESAEDVETWCDDLADAGLDTRIDASDAGHALVLVSCDLADLDDLDHARVTLGEIVAEAGHADWEDRALRALLAVPARPL